MISKTDSAKKFNTSFSYISSNRLLKRPSTIIDKQNEIKLLEGLNSTDATPKENKTRNVALKRKPTINSIDISSLNKQVSTLNTLVGNKTELLSIKPNESTSMLQNFQQNLNGGNNNMNLGKRLTMLPNQNFLNAFSRRASMNHKTTVGLKLPEKRLMLDSLLVPKSIARQSTMNMIDLIKDKDKDKDKESIKDQREPKENENLLSPHREHKDYNNSLVREKSERYLSGNTVSPCNGSKSANIRVITRFRPLNDVEKEFIQNNVGFITCEFPPEEDTSVIIKSDPNSNSSSTTSVFRYDKVFDMQTDQEQIYDYIGEETLTNVLNGYNGTIFSYGQSGSGKTFTMYGNDIYDETSKGLIPRIIDNLFSKIEDSNEECVFRLKFSIMQIYKEIIYDLLTGEKDLKVKESPIKGIYVEGLSEIYIDNADTFMEMLQMSQEQRVIAGTKLNQYSSRSHTIFMLEVIQTLTQKNITKRGILNLVDLAGTEKVSKTGAVGETLEEAKKINLSLSALGNVIHSLTSHSDHIPYRDSKLTRILQESLGGNYKTSLIVACSPHSYHLEETISSLKFAQRVKTIKNKVKMNIKISHEELQKINRNLQNELKLANKEIMCLKDMIKDSTQVDIINLIKTESEKQAIQTEIANNQLKLIEANPDLASNGNINIVNNSNASSVNFIFPMMNMNSKEDIDTAIKKLELMNQRRSFVDSSVQNNLKNSMDIGINIKSQNHVKEKELDSEDSEFSPSKSSSSSSNSHTNMDSHMESYNNSNMSMKKYSKQIMVESSSDSETLLKNKKIKSFQRRSLKKILKDKDIHIKELEEKIEKLNNEVSRKDEIIKESNKDIFLACRDVYEKFMKEFHNKLDNNLNNNDDNTNTDNILTSPSNSNANFLNNQNIEINELGEKISYTLNSYDKLHKLLLKELNLNYNQNLTQGIDKNITTIINFFKSFQNDSNFELENKILSSIFTHEELGNSPSFNINFLKTIQLKLNIELLEMFNINLFNQKKIVKNQNDILLSLFEEMLSLNQNLLQRMEKKKPNIGMENSSYIMDEKRKSVKAVVNCNSKIIKPINRVKQEVMKAAAKATVRRMSLDPGMSSLLQFQKQHFGLIENNSFVNNNDDTNLKTNVDMENIVQKMEKRKSNKFVNNPIPTNPKIVKPIINKFKANVMKATANASARRMSLEQGMSTLLQFQQKHFDTAENISNAIIEEANFNKENSDTSYEVNKSSFVNNTHSHKFLNSVIKSMDKCNEQLTSLKDFILRSFKESQKIKNNFDVIMQDIKIIVKEDTIENKFGTLEKNNSNYMISVSSQEESVKVNDKEFVNIDNLKVRNLVTGAKSPRNSVTSASARRNKICLTKCGILKLDEIDENEELDISSNNRFSSNRLETEENLNSNYRLLSTHSMWSSKSPTNRNKNNLITSYQDNADNSSVHSNNTKRSNLIDTSFNTIDRMFKKYSLTGCASKKLDRIIFKMNSRNKSLSIEYDGGLNCSNLIGSPFHKKLEIAEGDQTIKTLEEDIE